MSSSDLPLDKMNDVDWHKVTEQQAAGFSLTLSFFNDAVEQRAVVRAALMARISSLVTAGLVGMALLSWATPGAAVAGIVTALSVGTLSTGWYLHKADKNVSAAAKAVDAEAVELPRE